MLPLLARSKGISYSGKILNTSPKVYFPLNEVSGTDVINYGTLGAAANGTYSGVTLAQVPAPFGGLAPYFDGVNDYADVSSAAFLASFDITTFSLSLWLKMASASDWDALVDRCCINIIKDTENRVNIWAPAGSVPNRLYFQSSQSAVQEVRTTEAYHGTGWYQLSVTVDSTANEYKCFVNGILLSADIEQLGDWVGAPIAFFIGNYIPPGTSIPFKGYLAHVAVWSVVLTPAQILMLYNGGA